MWKPGDSPYADYIKSLTPEQLEAHKIKRAVKKSMKKSMQIIVEQQEAHWLAALNNAGAAVLAKAALKGDPQAYMAVYDRIIGKPQTEVIIDTETPLVWNDDFEDHSIDPTEEQDDE